MKGQKAIFLENNTWFELKKKHTSQIDLLAPGSPSNACHAGCLLISKHWCCGIICSIEFFDFHLPTNTFISYIHQAQEFIIGRILDQDE